jgi:hypothetical protein
MCVCNFFARPIAQYSQQLGVPGTAFPNKNIYYRSCKREKRSNMTELDLSAKPNAPQTKSVRHDVPVLRKHHEQDTQELEILLLAWSLLLYRHNHGNHVEFSWGLTEIGSSTCHTFTLNTAKLQWDGSNSVASELQVLRTYIQQQLPSEVSYTRDSYKFFFNDEPAQGGLVNQITQEDDISVNWVRTFPICHLGID